MSALGTYRVPGENLEALKAKLDKLARRSAKLGLPPITYEVGEAVDVPFSRGTQWDARIELKTVDQVADAKAAGKLVYVRFFPLTLSGETPRLAGYEFCATLQHLTDDTGAVINMLRLLPSFKEALPVEYRTASPENCDHCRKKIKTRKETFIVRHTESGAWKQVGRRCTQDFLGGLDPHAVAAQLEMVLSACSSCEDSEGFESWSSGEGRLPIELALASTAAVIRVDGWTSRGRARQDDRLFATADAVLALHAPPPKDHEARAEWENFCKERKTLPEDVEIAEKALEHARTVLALKEGLGDYEHNLYVATTQDSIGHKLMGITCSLVPYYLKEVERLVLSESRKISATGSVHFGTIGKREDFYLTCARVFTKEGNWGTTYIHSLVTVDGNLATWFASSNPEMKPGVVYRVAATVKAHAEYKGAKQTTLTRLSVYTEEGKALAEAKDAKRAAKLAKMAGKETKPVSSEPGPAMEAP